MFARSGDDFVRVTTSLKKQDGSRAIGTLLDRKGPAYAPLLANRSYTGLAALFGKRLITQYRPITDASGRVIGALFVGVNVDQEIQSVQDGIRNLKIGDSGYYFVLDASNGADRGKLIVHPAAAGQKADDANAPYQQMLDMKQGQLEYRSADATLGEHDARDKFVSFVTVPEWQWLVGGVAPRDEVMADVVATRNRIPADRLRAGRRVRGRVPDRGAASREPSARRSRASASERFASGDLSVRVAKHGERARRRNRPPDAVDRRHRRRSRAHRFAGAQCIGGYVGGHREDRHRQRQYRRADRHTGEQPRGNGGQHGTDHLDRAAERRPRDASQHARHARRRCRARRRPRGRTRGVDDGRDQPLVAEDRRDHHA